MKVYDLVTGADIVAHAVALHKGKCVVVVQKEPKECLFNSEIDARVFYRHPSTMLGWMTIFRENPDAQSFVARGMDNCALDQAENVPFACIGGLERRITPTVPDWIPKDQIEWFLVGYRAQAALQYGVMWRTDPFGWVMAMTLKAETK